MKLPGLIFLLFAITSIFCNSLQAQVDNFIGLSFGASNFHIVDEHSSPLIFRGTGIAPAIQYIHKGPRISQTVDGSFYYDNLSTTTNNFNTENFRGGLRYGLFYAPFRNNTGLNRFKYAVGGSLRSFYCKSDYYFDMSSFTARSISSWYWSHSLDFSSMFNFNLSDRDFINVRIFIPLVSNVSRPEFSPSGDYNYEKNDWIVKTFGETELFPHNFSVNAHFDYDHRILSHVSVQFGYEFYFANYNQPSRISMFMNNFRLGMFLILN